MTFHIISFLIPVVFSYKLVSTGSRTAGVKIDKPVKKFFFIPTPGAFVQ